MHPRYPRGYAPRMPDAERTEHEHQHAHDHAAFFDDSAATWDDDDKRARAAKIADAICEIVRPAGVESVFEYGAGTGLVTQMLGSRVGSATLAEPSAGMRDVIRAKIEAGTLPDCTDVIDLDLTVGPVPGERHELVVASMVLHHIADTGAVLKAFWDITSPGGHVLIADLDQEDGSFHAQMHDFHGHSGFDRDSLKRQLLDLGFVDVVFRDCAEVVKHDRPYSVFLAAARRP